MSKLKMTPMIKENSKTMPLSQNGVTLVEIMIVGGIAVVISAAVMSLTSVLFKSVKSVSLSQEAINSYETVGLALAANNCATNLGNPDFSAWESSPNQAITINKLSLFNQTIFQVDTPVNGIVAKSLTLTRVGGPSDIKINTSNTSGSAEINNLNRYHVKLTVNNQKYSNGEANLGGDAMKEKDFYFVADIYKNSKPATSLSAAQVKGKLFSCRGGQSIEFFKDICETGLGGQYDESKYPYCLLSRFVFHSNHIARDQVLFGTPALNSVNAGAPPPGVPPGSDTNSWLYADRGFVRVLNLGDGDWGLWGSSNTYRSWLGKCETPACTYPGDLGTNYLHISGKTNSNWPPNSIPNTGQRVIGLHDHVTIPSARGTFSIGTDNFKNSVAFIQDNRPASTGSSPWSGGRLAGLTLNAPSDQGTVLIYGAGESAATGSYSAVYLGDPTANNSWTLAHKKDGSFSFGKWKGSAYSEAFTITDSTMDLTSKGLITSTSDQQLKTDIKPLTGSLEKLLHIKGVSFRWKDEKRNQGKQIGLIAQNVETTFPELVKTNSDGFKAIAYQNLVAPIIEAIHELYFRFMQITQKQELEILKLKKENAQLKLALCESSPQLQYCQRNLNDE